MEKEKTKINRHFSDNQSETYQKSSRQGKHFQMLFSRCFKIQKHFFYTRFEPRSIEEPLSIGIKNKFLFSKHRNIIV